MRTKIISHYLPIHLVFIALCLLSITTTLLCPNIAYSEELPLTFTADLYRIDQNNPLLSSPANSAQEANKTGSQAAAQAIMAVVWLTPSHGYHFYANNPGDTGRPTEVIPAPQHADIRVFYPDGTPEKDIFDPTATVNVHHDKTPIFVYLPPSTGIGQDLQTQVTLSVSLLLCSDKNCLPLRKTLSLLIPANAAQSLRPIVTEPWWNTKRNYTAVRPYKSTAPAKQAAGSTDSRVVQKAKELGVQLPTTAGKGSISLAPSSAPSSAVSLSPQKGNLADVAQPAISDIEPVYFLQALEVTSSGKALLLGLIAGLLLNFMPCVLPVISLKLSSLVSATGITNERKRVASFREHNVFFALGILVWFGALAGILTTAEMAWGQLFQSEEVVIGLLLLVFALGLSTFGVFSLPMLNLQGSAGAEHNRWSAFSTGMLATLLATPCSGPFLGGVLGWAFMQPPLVLALIFFSVGIGMALPYILMAIWPGLVRHFPKPGDWTIVLERVVGFFLMGTAAYLMTILPAERWTAILMILWVVALAAWIWGRFSGLTAPRKQVLAVRTICTAMVAAAIFFFLQPPQKTLPWKTYSSTEFIQRLGKKPIMVDFTADWCPNCKVLEQTVLTSENRAKWHKRYGLTYVKVDLTNVNPEGEALLKQLGSQSIPVVAIFPAGMTEDGTLKENVLRPTVLRDLFTTDMAEEALAKALAK